MNCNANEEEEEEELLVYVDFKDNIDIENFKTIHVLGADTSRPVVQMDNMFFTGKYENPLGTYMFFEEDPNPEYAHHLFDTIPKQNLKYLYKTQKCLGAEHAFVTPKEGRDTSQPSQAGQAEDIEPVTFKNVKEALDKFKEYFDKSIDSGNIENTDKMDVSS